MPRKEQILDERDIVLTANCCVLLTGSQVKLFQEPGLPNIICNSKPKKIISRPYPSLAVVSVFRCRGFISSPQ